MCDAVDIILASTAGSFFVTLSVAILVTLWQMTNE